MKELLVKLHNVEKTEPVSAQQQQQPAPALNREEATATRSRLNELKTTPGERPTVEQERDKQSYFDTLLAYHRATAANTAGLDPRGGIVSPALKTEIEERIKDIDALLLAGFVQEDLAGQLKAEKKELLNILLAA